METDWDDLTFEEYVAKSPLVHVVCIQLVLMLVYLDDLHLKFLNAWNTHWQLRGLSSETSYAIDCVISRDEVGPPFYGRRPLAAGRTIDLPSASHHAALFG